MMANRNPKEEPLSEVLPPLSEAQIRAMIREEIAAAHTEAWQDLERRLMPWKHDADHGSIQARRVAQRERDNEAGIASE